MRRLAGSIFAVLLSAASLGWAQPQPQPQAQPQGGATPQRDAALATSLGADARGMKNFVLVVLKSGPNRMPDGPARSKMFEGHFANINRLAADQKLVLAGPLDGVDGWRGLYVFNTGDIDTARAYVALDPVITNGEMVAEYHKFYGSAALMMVNDIHNKIKP